MLPSNTVPPFGGICSSGYCSKTTNLRLNQLSTAGKITSARHTKIFYLAAAATLAWFITDIADTSLSLFADFVVEIDTTGLIYLTQVINSLTKKTSIISGYFIQGLSYFIAFVLAFRLNSQCDSKKVWLLLLIPVAVTAVVIGLELTMEIRCQNIGEILWQLLDRMTTMLQRLPRRLCGTFSAVSHQSHHWNYHFNDKVACKESVICWTVNPITILFQGTSKRSYSTNSQTGHEFVIR